MARYKVRYPEERDERARWGDHEPKAEGKPSKVGTILMIGGAIVAVGAAVAALVLPEKKADTKAPLPGAKKMPLPTEVKKDAKAKEVAT